MGTSTWRRGLLVAAVLLVLGWFAPASAWAERQVIGIAPLCSAVPNTGRGLADVLRRQIAEAGPWRAQSIEARASGMTFERWLAQLPEALDYLITGEVVAFTIADRDQGLGLSQDLGDLARQVGAGDSVGQVTLDLEVWRVADRALLAEWQVEGLESRSGSRLDCLSLGWAGSCDYLSDEFRQTMIGRAAYKAIGEVIYNLIELLPLTGRVLAVNGDAVVIDLGEQAGVAVGDELSLLESRAILSTTGDEVWVAEERRGSVCVIDVNSDSSLCLVLEATGELGEGLIARPLVAKYQLPEEADQR